MRVLSVLFLATASVLAAGNVLDDAYEAFYNLDYDQALAGYDQALAASPDDPGLHNHVAHTLLYRELFRNGALESQLVTGNNSFLRRARMEPAPDVEKRFFASINSSMAIGQARIAENARDTGALHTLAVAYSLRANYNLLVRKAWMASLSDASKARKYDSDVTRIDPGNYDARLIQGVYDYIVGSLPWSLRAVGLVAGFHGDKQRGLDTLVEVSEKGRDNRVDAEIILCALYRREGRSGRAIPLVTGLMERFPRNYLLSFELAQMYGAAGQRDKALETLAGIARRKEENAPGYGRVAWEKIYFETGNLQFWFNDLDHALENLQKVTATPDQLKELDLNTGVLALMRQGQIYDLQHRHNLAVKAYVQAIQFAPEAEAARESQHYINSPYKRGERG
jgi:tetratricopeptide (TPR) repeat protein